MATAGRHRAPAARLGRWLVPAFGAFTGWLALGDPFGAGGALTFLLLGLVLGLLYPVAAILLIQAPGALIPANARSWWRKGQVGRPHIPDWLRRLVYAADRYACAYCRSSYQLNLDHVKPWSVGGRTSFWNLVTLCGHCNRVKSNYWRFRSGRITYKAFNGTANLALAEAILAAERRHRYSIIRFIRAAVSL